MTFTDIIIASNISLKVICLTASKGFVLGSMQGFNEGSRQFIPSVLHTITGIGQGLWVFSKDPVHISKEFMEIVGMYIALAKDHFNASEIDEVIPEMNELLGRWAALTDFEKGRQTGFVIGKYGIDVFLTGKTIQLARKFRDAKYANGALTLEACENYIQRKSILEEAQQRTLFRQSLFKEGNISYRTTSERHFSLAKLAQQKHISMNKALDLVFDAGMQHLHFI